MHFYRNTNLILFIGVLLMALFLWKTLYMGGQLLGLW